MLKFLSGPKAQDEPALDTLYSWHLHAFVQVAVAEVGLVLSQGATEKIHCCNAVGFGTDNREPAIVRKR